MCVRCPCRSRMAKSCSHSAPLPGTYNFRALYCCVNDPHFSSDGLRATKTRIPHHPSPRRQSSAASNTRWLPARSLCQILQGQGRSECNRQCQTPLMTSTQPCWGEHKPHSKHKCSTPHGSTPDQELDELSSKEGCVY